ncbi:MAG TPA: DUF3300 domain-containing protein [Candidatus Acidoferrum sp.]|nr:DUF3300 domain-containing protein [Candidatus Acidoferrum sp.]
MMNFHTVSSRLTAVVCSIALVAATVPPMRAQPVSQEASAPAQEAPKIPNDQLDALVAPIALYPDPLLAQVLAASTYPLEVMQLQQWLTKNKDLKDKALADAVAKQPWDTSVQAMAPLPDLVKRLADDIQWATDLGNAFLAQQSDVMDAVQRMRAKAKDTGNLKSTEQMKVETKVIESKSVVVIEQSNPEVVYVPSYNPTVVYGPPVYPYPPIAYPPPGYYAAGMAISFGVGMAMGAAWGGGWGNCGWGGNNEININNNNNFNRNTNVSGGNRNTSVGSGNRGGNTGGGWKHNPQHRGGAPYANRSTANKFGGTARGDSMGNRQADARQRQQGAGNRASGGAGDRGGNRASGGVGDRGGDRAGASDRGGNRSSAGSRDSNRGGGGDRVGNRSVSSGSKGGAFGGSSGGAGGARASSSRGSSSMGGSRGGGGGRRR